MKTNEIATYGPVSIMVTGATNVERKLSVVRTADGSALTACMDLKGKIGAEIRGNIAEGGLQEVVMQAANGNYKPLAQVFAIRTGEPIVISNKSSFEALPDVFEARIQLAKLGKGGGVKLVDGLEVPGAKLKLAMDCYSLAIKCIAFAKHVAEERKTQQEAEAAAQS